MLLKGFAKFAECLFAFMPIQRSLCSNMDISELEKLNDDNMLGLKQVEQDTAKGLFEQCQSHVEKGKSGDSCNKGIQSRKQRRQAWFCMKLCTSPKMTIQDMTTRQLIEAFTMLPFDLGIAVLTSSSPTSHPSLIDHQVEMPECSVVIDN